MIYCEFPGCSNEGQFEVEYQDEYEGVVEVYCHEHLFAAPKGATITTIEDDFGDDSGFY